MHRPVSMQFLMQPIKRYHSRSMVLEEGTGSDAPMEPLHCPVSASIAGTEQHQTPAESFDGQICVRATEVGNHRRVRRRLPNKSIGKMDPRTPGWSRSQQAFWEVCTLPNRYELTPGVIPTARDKDVSLKPKHDCQ